MPMDVNLELLKLFGQIAAPAGIAIGAFVYVARDVIARNIFPTLTKERAYHLILMVALMAWTIALAGIASLTYVTTRPPPLSPALISPQKPVPSIPTYTENIGITYPDKDGNFVKFLESNIGKTINISAMLDMSQSSDESIQIGDVFGIDKFEESPSIEIPLDGMTQQNFLKLTLLGNRTLPLSFGGTGVVQFPLIGSFKVARIAQSGLTFIFHLTEIPVVVTEAAN